MILSRLRIKADGHNFHVPDSENLKITSLYIIYSFKPGVTPRLIYLYHIYCKSLTLLMIGFLY